MIRNLRFCINIDLPEEPTAQFENSTWGLLSIKKKFKILSICAPADHFNLLQLSLFWKKGSLKKTTCLAFIFFILSNPFVKMLLSDTLKVLFQGTLKEQKSLAWEYYQTLCPLQNSNTCSAALSETMNLYFKHDHCY